MTDRAYHSPVSQRTKSRYLKLRDFVRYGYRPGCMTSLDAGLDIPDMTTGLFEKWQGVRTKETTWAQTRYL